MRTIPERFFAPPRPNRRIITPASPECSANILTMNAVGPASGAWVSANDPVAIPITLPYGAVVSELGVANGSSAGDSVDIGIYDLSWNRMISSGSQTAAGASQIQWFDVTDTPIAPGRYYVVQVRSTVTANRVWYVNMSASNPVLAFIGAQDSATDALPLPDPLTNMAEAATATRVPIFAIAMRAHYA